MRSHTNGEHATCIFVITLKVILSVTKATGVGSSVTRFGESLPLCQKFTSLWQIFDGLFIIWQNAEPTLANLWHYWANFHCYKWPNIER